MAEEPREETERLEAWRLRYLLDAGFSLKQAEQLCSAKVDVHRASELLKRGCSPETAVRILV